MKPPAVKIITCEIALLVDFTIYLGGFTIYFYNEAPYRQNLTVECHTLDSPYITIVKILTY